MYTKYNDQPIGIFDSGVGGLTVLRALKKHLPNESFLYLADTARLPYGTKSSMTVTRYATQAAEILLQRGIKMLVIACNTASAFAAETLRELCKEIPVISVIEPGAAAACQASKTGRIVVIATQGTVRNGAYQRAIATLRPEACVIAESCQLFVALAEEGWISGPIVEAVARRYLEPLFNSNLAEQADCLVLGCTHFPVLYDTISQVVGKSISVVDSANTTALVVAQQLQKYNLFQANGTSSSLQFLTTDAPERFIRSAEQFLGESYLLPQVELVDFG
jgi:glutamate racemase